MSVPVLLTVAEAAQRLRCHPQTVRAMCRNGELAYQQRSRCAQVFIWESDVEAWLRSQRREPAHAP